MSCLLVTTYMFGFCVNLPAYGYLVELLPICLALRAVGGLLHAIVPSILIQYYHREGGSEGTVPCMLNCKVRH